MKRWIITGVCIFLGLCMVLMENSISKDINEAIPNAIMLTTNEKIPIDVEHLAPMIEGSVVGSTENKIIKLGNGQKFEATVVEVGKNYAQAAGLTILKGSDFGEGDDTVLISEEFARKYYFGKEIIGVSLSINDKTVQIQGVYKEPEDFRYKICKSEGDIVYHQIDGNENVQKTLLTGCSYSGRQAGDEFSKLIGRRVGVEDVRDYRQWKELGSYLARLSLYFYFLALAILLFTEGWNEVMKGIRTINKSGSQKEEIRKIIIGLVFVGASIVGAILLWPGLYLPEEILPDHHLLDIGHYMDWYVTERQKINMGSSQIWDRYLLETFPMAIKILIAEAFVLLLGIITFKIKSPLNKKP